MTRQNLRTRRMMSLLAQLIAAPALLLAACATTLPAGSDFDKSVDFSRYHSFQWMADDPLIAPRGSGEPISAMSRKHIVDEIEAELARKGYVKAESRETADFVLAYTVGKRDRIDLHSYPLAYQTSWYWHPYFWEVEHVTTTYTEGRLSVDVFDQHTRSPVWNGWAKKRITEQDEREPAPAIHEAVAAIFAQFPPRAPEAGKETN